MPSRPDLQRIGKRVTDFSDTAAIGRRRTNAGNTRFFAEGGTMKESKAMEMRHVAAMKKAGVPKRVVKEEMAEANAMKCGGKVKKYAKGGGVESKGKTKGRVISMR